MEALSLENFFTYDDYKQWEDSWELIDGEAYAMSPAPYPKHQSIVFKISKELDLNLNCKNTLCEVFISPIDWKIDDFNVVQPDVAIFCEKTNKQYFSLTPPLIVEVLSKATAKKDVTTKFKLYETNGVKFYIIIDPDNELIDIFELKNERYELLKKTTSEETFNFNLNDECYTKIDFSKIF